MRRVESSRTLLVAALLALQLWGCALDAATDEDLAGDPEAVARVSQALGNWSERWRSEEGAYVANVGTTYSVFARFRDDCGDEGREAQVVVTTTGVELDVPALPSCTNVTAAASDSVVFLGDSLRRKILYLSGTSSVDWAWTELATTPGDTISRILLSSSTVFWNDSAGIHRVPRAGGAVTTVAFSGWAFGIEGTSLYVQTRSIEAGTFTLTRMSTSPGVAPVILRTHNQSFNYLTFDANNFYWTENSFRGLSRLRRMSKSGATLSTVHSSEEVTYSETKTNGTALYWIEQAKLGETHRLRRRNHVSGNHVTTTLPWTDYGYLTLSPTHLYLLANEDGVPPFLGLFRGSL